MPKRFFLCLGVPGSDLVRVRVRVGVEVRVRVMLSTSYT